MPTWLFVALVIVTVLVFILVILQILWIRSKIYNLNFNSQKKELQLRRQVVDDVERSNRLQVYGVKIDCVAVDVLNSTSLRFGTDLLKFATPKSFMVPHVCSDAVKYMNIPMKQVGFLVAMKNKGTDDLVEDIIAQKIRYVIINNNYFLIHYDPTNSYSEMIKLIKKMDITGVSNTIDSRYVFFLYALSANATDDCIVKVTTFFGQGINPSTTTGTLLNLKQLIGFSSEKELPVHILGYKIV